MPPWGNAFTTEQIWELVAYIQHLSTLPPAN
jgi:mono/diheme cytochrome c family protein